MFRALYLVRVPQELFVVFYVLIAQVFYGGFTDTGIIAYLSKSQ